MSAGQIQHQQELFDEDDEVDIAAAGDFDASAAVSNDDVKVDNSEVQTINSRLLVRCSSDLHLDVLTMILLTAVNLLNYMDRFSVAGQFSDLFACL